MEVEQSLLVVVKVAKVEDLTVEMVADLAALDHLDMRMMNGFVMILAASLEVVAEMVDVVAVAGVASEALVAMAAMAIQLSGIYTLLAVAAYYYVPFYKKHGHDTIQYP